MPIVNLAGEWIFSRGLARPRHTRTATATPDDVMGPRSAWGARHRGSRKWRDTRDRIVRARDLVPPFLDWCVEQVAAASPRIVGLTSSFQQHAASLALARRLKDALPHLHIVMGGANCEGVMGAETVRQFPFVDAAVSGEADTIIVEVVTRLLEGRSIDEVPGVRTRASIAREFDAGRFATAPMVRDMDALPYPDYRDYVRQFMASGLSRHWRPSMLFESSRGCWWGEKAHCTFCGLNGSTMTYRSKRSDRVLAELRHLATTYPRSDVQVVDNILEMGYFGDLLPELARSGLKMELFYETKANLKKDHVRLLRDARVTQIQPGIESFSDPVLALMRKGVSWLQNVQLLKWCKQFGVRPYWNFLWGFPGEPAAEYGRMASLVPWLTHLPAPVGGAAIRLDRFSPNFDQAERLGFTRVRPVDAYAHIFAGLSNDAIGNLAYYFGFDYADGRDIQALCPPAQRAGGALEARAPAQRAGVGAPARSARDCGFASEGGIEADDSDRCRSRALRSVRRRRPRAPACRDCRRGFGIGRPRDRRAAAAAGRSRSARHRRPAISRAGDSPRGVPAARSRPRPDSASAENLSSTAFTKGADMAKKKPAKKKAAAKKKGKKKRKSPKVGVTNNAD